MVKRLDTKLIPPVILNLSKDGLTILMSITEEARPPNFAGIPPLYNSKPETASGGKMENSPKRCVGLKMGVSSNKIRFWSVVPPLMLTPLAASPTDVTPGSICKPLKISVSPIMAGIFLMALILSEETPKSGRATLPLIL